MMYSYSCSSARRRWIEIFHKIQTWKRHHATSARRPTTRHSHYDWACTTSKPLQSLPLSVTDTKQCRRFQYLCTSSKRGFFTTFSDNNNNNNTKDDATTNHHQKTTASEYDPFDKYRRTTLTEDVWKEIQAENERTRRAIDVELYERVFTEILRAYQRIPPPLPELGPTGQYLYDLYDNALTGRRLYRRQTSEEKANADNPSFQTVLEVSMHKFDLQFLSLSVDETLVAGLLEPLKNEQQQQQQQLNTNKLSKVVLVRHIESGSEIELMLSPDNRNHGEISSIEFGPKQPNGQHTLFMVTNDTLGRPDSVWACTVAVTNQDTDTAIQQTSKLRQIYQCADPAVMVDVQRTKGCQYVSIQANTKIGSEIYLMGSDLTQSPLLVRPRQEGAVYHLDVGLNGDIYLLISNSSNIFNSANNNQQASPSSSLGLELSLWRTSIDSLPLQTDFNAPIGILLVDPQREKEQEANHVITDMDIFQDFIALYERSTMDGSQRLRLLQEQKLSAGNPEEIIVPFNSSNEACATLSPGGNMYYGASSVRFMVDSPSSPARTYEYHLPSKKLKIISEDTTTEASDIRQQRVMVTSEDGTQVPLSLVYKEKKKFTSASDATRPAVLMGYGAYGEPMNLSYDPTLLPLLDRDFVLAFAHTRGGGDLGKAWYHRGRLYNKQRAIDDYLACAQALSGELKLTKPQKLTAKAFSAGGVVVGAAVNQRPDLFGSAVFTNAFLDVLKTMENDSLYLTEHEWDEYGNPTIDTIAAKAISSYCPVANASDVKEHKARLLIIAAFDDSQAPFWNAMIYGKKIRQNSRSKGDVNLHIESHGGHHLQGSRLQVAAMEAAFIIGNRTAYFGMRLD